MPKISSPIKYFGGKHYLCNKILDLFPPKETYHNFVELFSGGAVIALNHQHPNCALYINDLNGEIENFWRVIREDDLFTGFMRTIQDTPFSERLFYNTIDTQYMHPISRAVAFFVRNRLSRSADFNTFAGLTRTRTRRGMQEQASSYLTAIDALDAVHARLRGVVLLNRPALAVIDALDDAGSVFYADPPYLSTTRASAAGMQYEQTPGGAGCEMDIADHIALLDRLATIRGKFLLSGYASEMYSDYANEYDWNATRFEVALSSAGGDTKRIETEIVWRNFT